MLRDAAAEHCENCGARGRPARRCDTDLACHRACGHGCGYLRGRGVEGVACARSEVVQRLLKVKVWA
jgi:hypothetical protein